MRAIVKVGRKGIIVLPKLLREAVGVEVGSLVTLEVKNGLILLKPYAPKRVSLSGRVSEIVSAFKRDEVELEP